MFFLVPLGTNNLRKALIRRTAMNSSDMGYLERKCDGEFILSRSKKKKNQKAHVLGHENARLD